MERSIVTEKIRTGSHIGVWIALLAVSIYLIYSATHTNNESNEYTKGAKHEETSIDLSVHEYPLSFGCARFDLRGTPLDIRKEKKK